MNTILKNEDKLWHFSKIKTAWKRKNNLKDEDNLKYEDYLNNTITEENETLTIWNLGNLIVANWL